MSLESTINRQKPVTVIKSKRTNLKDAFASLANLNRRKELENLFSVAWVHVCTINPQASKLSEKAEINNIPQNEIRVSYIMWVDMLRCSVFEPLWKTSSRHSPTDPRPWTYAFEEYFYHPVSYARNLCISMALK